jgi:hypothetical protein
MQRMAEATFSMRHVWAGVAGSAAMLGAGAAEAAFTPPSLPAGAGYRIIFTTSEFTNALSSAIGDYNAVVAGSAATNPDLPSATWKAIGSTDGVSAADNIDCGATCNALPIFNVNGVKVAESIADFFDGSILVDLTTAQNGGSLGSYVKVWTGSTSSGLQQAGATLGSLASIVGLGQLTTNGDYLDHSSFSFGQYFRLYGISDALRIPDQTVPAPGGIVLMLLGLGALGAAGMRRPSSLH